MLSAAEEAIGPFREHIVHLEAATPISHERYTLATGGTPYGLAQWGGSGGRPDTHTTVEGLYVVGASTRYGSGITGAAVGGMACRRPDPGPCGCSPRSTGARCSATRRCCRRARRAGIRWPSPVGPMRRGARGLAGIG